MPNTGINQIKVMPLTVTVEKAEDNPTGRRRVKLSGFASRPEIDSDNEVIELGFFDRFLPDFLANPVMLWQHKRGDEQGLWTSVEPVPGEGYYVEGYMVDLGTPEDARRCAMAEEGIIRSLSVGFNAQYSPEYGYQNEETGAWHWTQNGKLMEISPVTFPACQNARFAVAKAAGFELAHRGEDTPAESEEDRAVRNLERLAGAAESLGNISRHWAKEGGGPSAEMAETAVRSITAALGILKAGRMLSAANRGVVESAVEALLELLAKDDASRETPEDDAKGGGVLRVVMPEPPRVTLTSGE
ncbi:MAG: HK97 family phage prohead protease [Armatimonadetes bacterium]|nr:HK97 family phage prohead protease [Armatimonadota bacterium]